MTRLLLTIICLAGTIATGADLFDLFKKKSPDTSSVRLQGFSQDQLAQALRQALDAGVINAVTNLGRPGGFLQNPKVKIPMPEKLAGLERTLRSLKQDRLADEFVASMNRAAEAAVPEALPIFRDALQSMTIDDAKALLTGGDDSATQFFKRKGEKQVRARMLPIIKQSTEKAGVTSAYKRLLDQVGGATGLLGKWNTSSLDIDSYVTEKASDGLFTMVAAEEKRIRENPAARTTELLEKVFGAVKPRS